MSRVPMPLKTGVILAGGKGTRLMPLTSVTNKHLVRVLDKPMIHYPIETLKNNGILNIVIVSGGEHIGDFCEYLKDGSEFGVDITYRVQKEAGGIAQALGCVEGLVKSIFAVILGDNYFSSVDITSDPSIFIKEVSDPSRFGVFDNSKRHIIEKPSQPKSNYVVTGLYVYPDKVFNYIKTLKPSKRGELEITDVNNWLLKDEKTKIQKIDTFWSDMGTHESLKRTEEFIHAL